jgi:hypothetical protein
VSLETQPPCSTIVTAFAASALLFGCSDATQKDMAYCKVKAMEIYRPPAIESEWGSEPLAYVFQCMLASG